MRNALLFVLVLSFSSAHASGGIRFHLDLGAPVWQGYVPHHGGYGYRGPVYYERRYYGPPPGGWNYHPAPVYRERVIRYRWGGTWQPRYQYHHGQHHRW